MTIASKPSSTVDVSADPPSRAAVGVVVLNWNGWRDTIACLESLIRASPSASRVVVVDNASRDDSMEQLVAWAENVGVELMTAREDERAAATPRNFPAVTLIRSSWNRGFSGGCNVGLRFLESAAELTHYLLLNNDATVAADYFARVDDALDAVPRAGLLCGTIFEGMPPSCRVWYAGGSSSPLRALVSHQVEVPESAVPIPTSFITGCAMIISRDALATVGLMPECYFPAYMEDAEYSLRVRRAGFPAVYAPRVLAYHKVGASLGVAAIRPAVVRAFNRHRAFYVRRNMTGWTRRAALAYLIVTKPARAAVEALRGRPRIGWAVLAGFVSGLFSKAADA